VTVSETVTESETESVSTSAMFEFSDTVTASEVLTGRVTVGVLTVSVTVTASDTLIAI
jgi:hypothetical protein